MQPNDLDGILACPKCKKKLIITNNQGRCSQCTISYSKKDGVWALISFESKKLAKSATAYEKLHQKPWKAISDGSYEILASIARGNRTLDIACGQGFLEELAPETVGVDFSFQSLKQAQKRGAKNLVWATAENLPFSNNAFEVAICAGSLEQFENPQLAILEMGRVAKIQVLTVHREFNFPFAPKLRWLVAKIFGVKNQPIEKPLRWGQLKKMLEAAKLHIVFSGFWAFPINFGRVFKLLPVFKNIPSCFFVITIKR